MSEVPHSKELGPRSVTTIDTNLLHRLEMVKAFFENEGVKGDTIQTFFGTDDLTVDVLVDKAVEIFVRSVGIELSEETEG